MRWIICAIDRHKLGAPHKGCGVDFSKRPPKLTLARSMKTVDDFASKGEVEKIIHKIMEDPSIGTELCVNAAVLAKYTLVPMEVAKDGDRGS